MTAVVFVVHLFAHVAAVTIDPADASVRAKRNYSSPMPLFDRTKQSHVIQDLHCYLCDVTVYVSRTIRSRRGNVLINSIDILNLYSAAPKSNTAAFATNVWQTLITTANG